MAFIPPRCPNTECVHHTEPQPGFFRRRGLYFPNCRSRGVQRYRCAGCGRSFSRQTFGHDYRDRRPETNERLFDLVTSGVGFRQAGRLLRMDVRAVQQKQRKMARMLGLLHANLSPSLPEGRTFLLDEEETYEGASIRPLTMPVLIERQTWFVIATAVGSIRRLAQAGTERRELQDREEADVGKRPDQSKECVRAVLGELARRVASGSITLQTDQKSSYATIAIGVFGDRLTHLTTAGTLVRSTHNPLFPINTTLAMTRDNCGRLRRRSWLVTKKAERLQDHLHVFTAYRNYVRRRFNRDEEHETPAKLLGLLPRSLSVRELLAWRQDWGNRSIHPMSNDGARLVCDRMAD